MTRDRGQRLLIVLLLATLAYGVALRTGQVLFVVSELGGFV